MGESLYRLLMTGKVLPGEDAAEVEASLILVLKLPKDKARYLLRGEVTELKKNLSLDSAERLQKKLRRCGAETVLEPMGVVAEEASQHGIGLLGDSEPSDFEADTQPIMPVEDLDLDLPTEDDSVEPEISTDHDENAVDDSSEKVVEDEAVANGSGAQPESSVQRSDTEEMLDEEVILASPPPIAPPLRDQQPEEDEQPEEEVPAQSASSENSDVDNAGQFYHVRSEPAPEKKSSSKSVDPKLLAVAGAVLLVAAGAWAYLNLWSNEAEPMPVAVESKPAKPKNPQRAATLSGLENLSSSVRIWMIQFGSGFNPTQVSIDRLQMDLGLSEGDLKDAWGTPFQYQAMTGAYRVSSAGPDRQFGTQDDLQKEVKQQ